MSYNANALFVAAMGQRLPDGALLDPGSIFSYLSNKGFGAVIDCSENTDNQQEANKHGLSYQNIYADIPSSTIIKSPLYFDLLTEDQQRAYRVPVLLDHYALHRLPINLFNTGLRHPDKKIALLFSDMNFSSILRLHLSASVAAGDITGINLHHMIPAFGTDPSEHRQDAELFQVNNQQVNFDWQTSYEILSGLTEIPFDPHLWLSGYRSVKAMELRYFSEWFNNSERPLVMPYKAVDHGDDRNVYLLEYVPANRGGGAYNEKVWRFKSGDKLEVAIQKRAFVESVRERGVKFDLVVRALNSREMSAVSSPLDEIGAELESLLGYAYHPEILYKTRPVSNLKYMNLRERQQAVKGVYVACSDEDWNNRNILIIDDVYTSGTTSREITRAIRTVWPKAVIYGHFLSRTI